MIELIKFELNYLSKLIRRKLLQLVSERFKSEDLEKEQKGGEMKRRLFPVGVMEINSEFK